MKVGLFIPCFINAVYPEVGVACYKLLEHYGVDHDMSVDYPLEQSCCGQPMANAGFEEESQELLQKMDRLFESYDYVVGPSASCVSFVKSDHKCHTSEKIYDICEFLYDILKVKSAPGHFPHKVSVHNSCHGVRELGLSSASELNVSRYSKLKSLLSMVDGCEVFEPERVDECCGFGGMFSVEEQAVSSCMAQDKVAAHMATGAEYITGADNSCMMHMKGVVDREKLNIKFIHIVEILSAGL